ncbi:hypothetical protein PR003_g3026 [Phytophthora rubi]|uniref:Uncharacterized protein n=1 Tax=Phytophthora rubi TaxID=129364 RepID=A0A6A3NQR9_9STRA|nr:hypothetical protein PR001_g8847 [Phytophthora rubi]KAE9043866.1 hypothetical protein PR002_g3115 [Phytophthora rubi]KAE9355085.1 hypothetical protein PR003_g3026 [Phytophthora rubi]
MHQSKEYDAHMVPELHAEIKMEIVQALQGGGFGPHGVGVYVQMTGPRFETKSKGIGDPLILEAFEATQMSNTDLIETAT